MSNSGELPTLDLAQCPCSGGTLDKLIQPAIFVVLAEGPLHGYAIVERIGLLPHFDEKPDASGVYRFLKAMERRGLVVASWDVSEAGPARKCYQLTGDGQRCLQQWVATLEDYRRGVDALLKAARKAATK